MYAKNFNPDLNADPTKPGEQVNMGCYVDDWRLYYDPTPGAKTEGEYVHRRLGERFKIDFREVDPANDFLLGSNRISLDRDSAPLEGTSFKLHRADGRALPWEPRGVE